VLSVLYNRLIEARIELGRVEGVATDDIQLLIAQQNVEAALEDVNRVLRQCGKPEICTKKSIRVVEAPYAEV
jgi:hypothetical protein